MAPIIVEVTLGCVATQLSATCAAVRSSCFRNFQHSVQDLPVPLGKLLERGIICLLQHFQSAARAAVGTLVPLVFAGQKTAGQGAPRADTHAQFASGRNVLEFDGPLDQRIFELQRDGRLMAMALCQRLRARGIPRGNVREAVVADLPFAHQRVERVDDLSDRRYRVPHVHPVKIDEVHIESAQRPLQRAIDILAAVATRVRIALLRIEGELAGDHELVAQTGVGDEPAQQFLRLSVGVHVGAVHHVAAALHVAIEDAA